MTDKLLISKQKIETELNRLIEDSQYASNAAYSQIMFKIGVLRTKLNQINLEIHHRDFVGPMIPHSVLFERYESARKAKMMKKIDSVAIDMLARLKG